MIVAAWSDAIDFTIPNRLVVSLLVLYPAYVMTASHAIDWPMALAVATSAATTGSMIIYYDDALSVRSTATSVSSISQDSWQEVSATHF